MTARYLIEGTPAVRRALESFPKKVLKQIDKRILALADNPYPPGSKNYRIQQICAASGWDTTVLSTSRRRRALQL